MYIIVLKIERTLLVVRYLFKQNLHEITRS